jgi:hypothetical protein
MFLWPKDNLRETFAVAKIDENNAAVIPAGVYPPGEGDGLT